MRSRGGNGGDGGDAEEDPGDGGSGGRGIGMGVVTNANFKKDGDPGSQGELCTGSNTCEAQRSLGLTGVCGCTDKSATNYNSAATIDDGSCEYSAPSLEGQCAGVTHSSPCSVLHVCANWDNVPEGTQMNVAMGSSTTTTTVDSDGKGCVNFDICAYGSYSGSAGVTTSGGVGVYDWSINVTSANVACSKGSI